jgi:predicted  nucleic acid-binding Zn-ribbon protein
VVIANRLWKKAFGIGLVEPVDDFKDDTLASNPVLMKFLTDEMVKNKYDMRKYMKMLFNTRTYQRQATTAEVSTEEPYYFQGPVLRRMSGEQIWDSLVTLMIPNPDYRKRSGGYQNRLASMKAAADELQKKFVDNPQGAKTLVEMALKGRDAARAFEGKISDLRRQLDKAREGKDVKLTADLQKQLAKAQEEQEVARYKAIGLVEDKLDQSMEKASFFKPKKMEEMKPENKESVDPENRFTSADWEGYSEEYYRASELASPMPQSHFLRVFGQSDRNVIENAWIDASVTQALALMNGDIYDELTSEKSMLYQALKDAVTPTEKAKILWNSVLNRDPSDQEKAMVVEFFNKMSESRKASGWKELFWCLLNGREFIFVQ